MTSGEPPDLQRVAVIGTGLIGTSVALASARVGCEVSGWDENAATVHGAAERGGFVAAASLEAAVEGADLVVVATPIPTIAALVARVLDATSDAIVTDAGSIKAHLVSEVARIASPKQLARYIPGHPMGGSERSGPDHASASVLDGIVWVLTPTEASDPILIERLAAWIELIGASPVRMAPDRHDRLVAFVSHLPQIASTALMAVAATEEADEPEILLLAAGGFRDLTRLASSNPVLWSDILLANREQIAMAIDLYVGRLNDLRDRIAGKDAEGVMATFETAKRARLTLAAKPKVRAGVAVISIAIPDRPGALASLTSGLAEGDVNIEDLQIVHSPEGGRGTVHLTVVADDAQSAAQVLADGGFDPTRIA